MKNYKFINLFFSNHRIYIKIESLSYLDPLNVQDSSISTLSHRFIAFLVNKR